MLSTRSVDALNHSIINLSTDRASKTLVSQITGSFQHKIVVGACLHRLISTENVTILVVLANILFKWVYAHVCLGIHSLRKKEDAIWKLPAQNLMKRLINQDTNVSAEKDFKETNKHSHACWNVQPMKFFQQTSLHANVKRVCLEIQLRNNARTTAHKMKSMTEVCKLANVKMDL